jgi:hypothetical protein
VGRTCLGSREICYWLSKNKRTCRRLLPTTDARLYHIGQPEGLYTESAADGSRTPCPSVAQQSPPPSFDSSVLHPLLIPSPSPPPSLPSLSSLRLPSPSRTSLSSRLPPRCNVNLRYAGISPLTHNRDAVDGREGINGTDPSDISKRQSRNFPIPLVADR